MSARSRPSSPHTQRLRLDVQQDDAPVIRILGLRYPAFLAQVALVVDDGRECGIAIPDDIADPDLLLQRVRADHPLEDILRQTVQCVEPLLLLR